MNTLALRCTWAEPAPDEPSPHGRGRITHGQQLAYVLAPDAIDPSRTYPLVVVLHGAGRQDEMLARMLAPEAERRQTIFIVPRSYDMTWDLITGGDGEDVAFLGLVLDTVYRSFRIDQTRQAMLGFSDGASYGLAVGLSNPRIFSAVMGWAAGFLAIDAQNLREDDPKPRVFLEYGTHDQLFAYDKVAVPMRDLLQRLGYPLEFRTDEGGIHWPRPDFASDALDWFLASPAA